MQQRVLPKICRVEGLHADQLIVQDRLQQVNTVRKKLKVVVNACGYEDALEKCAGKQQQREGSKPT